MKYLLSFVVLMFSFNCFGQSDESRNAENSVNQLNYKAGVKFSEGLMELKDGRRSKAGERFDEAVEVFLMSGISLTAKSGERAGACYKQLAETIFRIEFPSDANLPQVRQLSATCGWNVENKLADEIVAIVRQSNQPKTVDNSVTAAKVNNIPLGELTGFNSETFEPSPLDELTKLELAETVTSKREGKVLLNFRTIRAQSGDTVEKLARRNNLNAAELAKLNGLFTTSLLNSGRLLRTPEIVSKADLSISKSKNLPTRVIKSENKKPAQKTNGEFPAIIKYFDENMHDPYSLRVVKWGVPAKAIHKGIDCWSVYVKYRAKNTFAAFVLTENIFYIYNNLVIGVLD